MNILISGATGYLGSNLINSMFGDGHNFILLKRQNSLLARINECILPQLTMINIDSPNWQALLDQEQVDIIIHTATSYGRNNETLDNLIHTNIVFPIDLLNFSLKNHVKAFINTDTSLSPSVSAYSLTKNHFIDYAKLLNAKKKLSFVNVKMEHMYGPHDDLSKFTSFVINKCVRHESEIPLTRGEQLRDFIYIDDVVDAYKTIVNHVPFIDKGFVEFELGSGNAITIKQFVSMVHEFSQSKSKLLFGALPYRENEAMLSKADLTGLSKLGWNCKTSLEQGIRSIIEKEYGI